MPPRTRRTQETAAAVEQSRADMLAAFLGKHGKQSTGTVFTFNGPGLAVPCIPTGAVSLDAALGIGGVPQGRVIEIFGPESAGKTSLALSIAAQAIKAGGIAALVDAEHAVTKSQLEQMGADPDYFAITQPDSGEDGLSKCEEFIESGVFSVVIVDSVSALVPKSELEGDIGDQSVGAQARLMSKALRRITPLAARKNVTVIFINQLREKIGVMFGNPETTSGGRALRFYASVRMSVRSPAGQTVKENGEPIGLGTTVTVVKNKVAPPQQKAEYQLIWGVGLNQPKAVFELGQEMGLIIEASQHTWADAATGNVIAKGKQNAITALKDDPVLLQQLVDRIHQTLRERNTGVVESEDGVPALPPEDAFEGAFDESEPISA